MWLSNVAWQDDLFGARFLMKLPNSLPENTDEHYAAIELIRRLLENAKQCWEVKGTKRRSAGPPYGQPRTCQAAAAPATGSAAAVTARD